MSIRGTASYEGVDGLPPQVTRAVQLAKDLGFESSCRLEQGRLLHVLATGRHGGVIGEAGTGCGVGLSWLLSGASNDTRLFSVESDVGRARACQKLFGEYDNVRIETGDWTNLLSHGPFDVLVLDGGASAKGNATVIVDQVLTLGGTLVIDDFTPFTEWPPMHRGDRDEARLSWLEHPELLATEVRLASDLSTILATRFT